MFAPIHVSAEILSEHQRTTVTSKFSRIGCQHIYIYKYLGDSNSSTPNSSASEGLIDDDSEPILKKLKTCQKNKNAEFENELDRHKRNSIDLTGNKVVIDVLIFCSSKTAVQKLAKYLGLICLEDLIEEAKINANKVDVLDRLFNENAKICRLKYLCLQKIDDWL